MQKSLRPFRISHIQIQCSYGYTRRFCLMLLANGIVQYNQLHSILNFDILLDRFAKKHNGRRQEIVLIFSVFLDNHKYYSMSFLIIKKTLTHYILNKKEAKNIWLIKDWLNNLVSGPTVWLNENQKIQFKKLFQSFSWRYNIDICHLINKRFYISLNYIVVITR